MFAPEDFVPIAVSKGWMLDRADEFYRDCLLPWATKQVAGDCEANKANPFEIALFGRALYVEWLINTCLVYQPAPVYLASPTGDVMRAANVFFEADEHLSWYDFEWPLSDDELKPIVESRQAEQILDARFGYYFWDMWSCCLVVPKADDRSRLSPEAQALLPHVEPFNGWSVCFKNDDCEKIEEVLTDLFSWSGPQDKTAKKGRPRKQEAAAKLYHSLYPDGHEAKAHTWQQAAQSIGQVGKMTVSIDTLRRGLAKY